MPLNMLSELNFTLQCTSTALLVLVMLFFAKQARHNKNTWAGIAFTFSIVCYLLVESDIARLHPSIFYVLLTGAIGTPLFFWLLARTIFEDHFKPAFSTLIWVLVHFSTHYASFFIRRTYRFSELLTTFVHLLPQLVSIGLLLAGLYTAVRTRQADLLASRIHFRKIFVFGTACLIGLTLIVEIATFGDNAPIALQAAQRAGVLLVTTWFLLANLDLRTGFFFRPAPHSPESIAEDPLLEKKLWFLVANDKIYCKEGLTIRDLSTLMNEQEYRLRRLINGRLGFRNFNDFLNQHRVKEACQVFDDPEQDRKTILEVAYQLGYQSIGPFNKAFRELTGTTPTEYRKERKKNNPS